MSQQSNGESYERELLLTASRFRVERVKYSLPSGELIQKEVIRHPGAVVIVPVMNDGRICLIKNFRIAVNQTLLELPAGTLEPPEPPQETARRELIEETGFRCDSMQSLINFHMSPGILDEQMHAFVATGLQAGDKALEKGEQIVNYPVTINELNEIIKRGELKDSKSLSTLLYYLHVYTAQN